MAFLKNKYTEIFINADPDLQLGFLWLSVCNALFTKPLKHKKSSDFSELFCSAVWTGLEPATPCVTGMYSNQLNYQTVSFDHLSD